MQRPHNDRFNLRFEVVVKRMQELVMGQVEFARSKVVSLARQ